MGRKGYYRFVLDSIRYLFNEKNRQLIEFYNYKKDLKNGK